MVNLAAVALPSKARCSHLHHLNVTHRSTPLKRACQLTDDLV